ncbi:hypothetical protein F7725_023683 [Dissostichus mawsoni]|uniref:Enoyl reductase (ER) domain-containing protein n=1 Tax=Dissostichus mawsoni TaxID=36200 RepID=A0A7J5XXB7_DISMA|nr:hypothetical protein F7725_023683 [Dissostichus mawsoni]
MKGLYCRAGHAEPKFVIQEMVLPDVLGSHLVRVQVKACGLSPLDLKLLNDVGIQRDFIPVGREVSGVVLQVGAKVSFFQPQDEVVVQKPEKLSPVCVAGALRDGLSAYTALHTHARMAAGHTLLVLDGGSVPKVIPVYKDQSELLSVVMEETGGLGVDIVIDSGVGPSRLPTAAFEICLSDVPQPRGWTASSAQQGRYLRIL